MVDITKTGPLVTVGICCYNREQGLKNTLRYIASQTYRNLEIIVSQDFNEHLDLGPVAAAGNDGRLTFYKQPKRLSMYNNFRFLLEKATGGYFMWASDDDWWAPEFIEKIMERLLSEPAAVAGFSDFIEVDVDHQRLPGYPDHLPLLLEFTTKDDARRIRNYINQFEGFGKANLFYAVFKTEILRSAQVLDILADCGLAGDMLVNLTVLARGPLAVVPQILRTSTGGNEKSYSEEDYRPVVKDLVIARINTAGLAYTYKKWSGFIYHYRTIVDKSALPITIKIALYPTLLKKILLFYYDLICAHVQVKGYNIFARIGRKHKLN